MTISISENETDKIAAKLLKIIPPLARYTRNQGVPYLISWAQRISGVFLVMFMGFHIFTLSFIPTPDVYAEKMKLYQLPVLTFLEWAMAIPVIFHALNGGRLILYESFRYRKDDVLLKWVTGLTVLYAGILGMLILIGNQNVSPAFYWSIAVSAALTTSYGLYLRIWRTHHVWSWKLQRITGAFLLVMIPAHFLFMHLNPQVAKDVGMVTLRMQNLWMKLVDVTLVASALYHGGYGLISILYDYTAAKNLRVAGMAAISAAMVVAAWFGLKLIILI